MWILKILALRQKDGRDTGKYEQPHTQHLNRTIQSELRGQVSLPLPVPPTPGTPLRCSQHMQDFPCHNINTLLRDSLLSCPCLPMKHKLSESEDLVFFVTAMSLEPSMAHGTVQALSQKGMNNNSKH